MIYRILRLIVRSYKQVGHKTSFSLCSLLALSACSQQIYPPLSATDLANSLKISPSTISFHPSYCEYAEVPTKTQEANFKRCIYSQTDKEIILAEQAAYEYRQWNNQQRSAINVIALPFKEIHSVGISKSAFQAAQLHLVRKGEVGKSMIVINFLDNQLRREDNPNTLNSVHALLQAQGIPDAQYDLAYVDYYQPLNYQPLKRDDSVEALGKLLQSINEQRERKAWQKREDLDKQVAEDTRIFNEGYSRYGPGYYDRESKIFTPLIIDAPVASKPDIAPVPQYTPPPAWQNNLRLPR